MTILSIETSCDETSAAIVEDGSTVHSLVINSQIDLHKAFGGVVPEIAARSHIEVILPVVKQALDDAFGQTEERRSKIEERQPDPQSPVPNLRSKHWDNIDAIAVTQGPGLLGSLLIGVTNARTLAWSLNKPLYPIHHILGHVYANWITGTKEQASELIFPTKQPTFPVLALIVSGGHSQLMLGTDHQNWRVIGRTQDDAVGEAFDKVAKVLGLPYPGGPSIARTAENGDPSRYKLPISHLEEPYNFSFSGLKTAVLRAIQAELKVGYNFPSFELAEKLSEQQRADFAASFQATAIKTLVTKTKKAFEEYNPQTVIIGGGVAASLPLRSALQKALPVEIEYAPPVLCTDNAAMIGARAFYQAQFTKPAKPHAVEAIPTWPL